MKPIFIIMGEKKSGKTTFLLNLIDLIRADLILVEGFVALHDTDSDKYIIKNIKTEDESPLMKRVASFEKRPFQFKFFPEGIEMGNLWVNEILDNEPQLAIIDEVGNYELSGALWCDSFTKLINSPIPLLFSTKSKLIDRVVERWQIKPMLIFTSSEFKTPQQAFDQIKYYLL